MTPNEQNNTNRKNLKLLLILCVFMALFLAVVIPITIQKNNQKAAELAAEEQKKQANFQVVEALVLPIAQAHGISDLKVSSMYRFEKEIYFTSDEFAQLNDEAKYLFLYEVAQKGHEPGFSFPEGSEYYYTEFTDYIVRSDDYYYKLFSRVPSDLKRARASSTYYETIFEDENASSIVDTNSSPSSGQKCYWCNGTGSVRYNYGSSDLEAILSGHDPYTYGTCASCGGTGKAK